MPESSSSVRRSRAWAAVGWVNVSAIYHCGVRAWALRGLKTHRARGFTLVELLAVLAIIGILAAIVFGGGQRANELGKAAKGKAELAALSAALESYHRRHGDYPRAASGSELLQALIGKRGPTGATVESRALIDLAHFTVAGGGDPFVDSTAALVDPWGLPYFYFYKSGAPTAWLVHGFVFYSAGPNGTHEPPNPSSGFYDPSIAVNADNLYANR